MNAKLVIFFLSILSFFDTRAITKGSTTLPSVEPYYTFPQNVGILGPNQIVGFGWFNTGFALQNSSTNLIYNAVFPVSGTVNLAGGTLTLNQDFIFNNVTSLNGLGIVLANGQSVGLCPSIKKLPANTKQFDTVNLFFAGDLQLQSVVTFSGACLINGNNNKLDLTNGAICVASNSSLHLSNVDLKGVAEGKIYCADDSASIILDNINWIQDASTTFSLGSITFCHEVNFCGTGTFYLSNQLTNTINDVSTWEISDDLTVVTGRNAVNNQEPLYFTSDRSVLYLDNVDFQCTTSGMSLTNGTLVFNRYVGLNFIGTTTQTGVILGNGNPANDIHVILNPGTSVDLQGGYWVYNNGNPNRLQSNSTSASLIREANSYVYVAQDLVLSTCTIDIASELVLPIDIAPGVMLSYDDCVVKLPFVELDITANQVGPFTYQLDGNNSIFFTRGTLPFAVEITGQNNQVKGNGSISGPIIFSDSGSALLLEINGFLENTIILNNGTLTLNSPLVLSANGLVNGPGTIDLATYATQLSRTVNVWPTPVEWLDSLGQVELLGPLSLLDTWTFSGNVTLNGHGNTLSLGALGAIVAGTNSSLTLKDIQITGVNSNNVACVDNSSTLILSNAKLILDGNYTFTQGNIYFVNDNILTGSYNFVYQSVYTSTIASAASLSCSGNINFQLGKSSPNTTQQPLVFTDKTSTLIFDQSTLNVQLYGYQMTRGTLISNRNNVFAIQSTNTSNGLTLGDGTSSGDMTVQLNPGSTLTLSKGHLNYNLSSPIQGIVGQTQTAQLIVSPAFITHFISSANINNITYVLNPPANFTQDPGAQVTFTNILAVTPVGTFNVTGTRVSTTQIALNGNNQLAILTGQFPSLLSVSGTGNTLSGSGTVSGVVTLANSSAALTSALTGKYLQTIALNGGTLALGSAHQLGNNIVLTGPGTVNMGAQTLELGYNPISWPTSLLWQGTAATLTFHSNVSLQSTWTIAGNLTIQGNNFELDLSQNNAQIIVQDNTTLTLDSLRVKNLSGNKITCLGNNSLLVLDNTRLTLNNYYSFPAGAMQYKHKNEILGGFIFAYQTQMTSTVLQDAQLIFDHEITFSYDPISGSQNLFQFIDDSSELILNRSTLYTTTVGIQLMQGSMLVQNDSFFQSEVGDDYYGEFGNGITLGDGLNPLNDFYVQILPGVTLDVTEGSLILRNLDPQAFSFVNAVSTLHMYSFTSLLAYENISFLTGRVIFEDQSTLGIVPGNVFDAAISPFGALFRIALTP